MPVATAGPRMLRCTGDPYYLLVASSLRLRCSWPAAAITSRRPPHHRQRSRSSPCKLKAAPITTELPGHVNALRTADVRPQVSGISLKRLFVEGGEVKAGQQLYQIDPAPSKVASDSALAAQASARALAERYSPWPRPMRSANRITTTPLPRICRRKRRSRRRAST